MRAKIFSFLTGGRCDKYEKDVWLVLQVELSLHPSKLIFYSKIILSFRFIRETQNMGGENLVSNLVIAENFMHFFMDVKMSNFILRSLHKKITREIWKLSSNHKISFVMCSWKKFIFFVHLKWNHSLCCSVI